MTSDCNPIAWLMVKIADKAGWLNLADPHVIESYFAVHVKEEEIARNWWRIPPFSIVITPMRLLESAALLAMGLALGVYVSNVEQRALDGGQVEIRDFDSNTKLVTFTIAGEQTVKGTLTDENVRLFLLLTLTSSRNPSMRGRAIDLLSASSTDVSTKFALIQALNDSAAQIRLKSIDALAPYAAEPAVTEAMMDIARNDADPLVRERATSFLARRQ